MCVKYMYVCTSKMFDLCWKQKCSPGVDQKKKSLDILFTCIDFV